MSLDKIKLMVCERWTVDQIIQFGRFLKKILVNICLVIVELEMALTIPALKECKIEANNSAAQVYRIPAMKISNIFLTL